MSCPVFGEGYTIIALREFNGSRHPRYLLVAAAVGQVIVHCNYSTATISTRDTVVYLKATLSKDIMSKEERSKRMSLIKGKDTKPELFLRKLVHGLGYRYRLNKKNLPGKPDLVFKSKQKVIFVHGCFWHLHDCGKYNLPKTRRDFWLPKLERNVQRDDQNKIALQSMGYDVLEIWECELKDVESIKLKIIEFLG